MKVMEEMAMQEEEYPDVDAEPSYAWISGPSTTWKGRASGSPAGDESEQWAGDDRFSSGDSDAEDMIHDSLIRSPKTRRTHVDAEQSSSDESSDEDDEFYTLQSDVATFQRRLRREQVSHRDQGEPDVDDPAWKKGGKRGRKGPRKAVEPTLEIKLLLAQANEAFIAKDYDRAEDLATRVIQMNAETYAAHALLSGIFLERGETQMGIVAQMSAAHLRPTDVGLWQSCINLILDNRREDRSSYLKDAIYCYTRMVRIDPKDLEARYQRALLLRELGHKGRAAHEFEQMLDMLPHDTTILRQLAEVYVDLGEIDKAKQQYRRHISLASEVDGLPGDSFTWSDVNIFVELLGYSGEYVDGIKELKSLSRWLLGRELEKYWDDIQQDDREWDADDSPRRIATEGFTQGLYTREAYGDGLPLELRVKLGIYRLKADPGQFAEAMSHFEWLQPEDCHLGARLFDYPDLFQEVADTLVACCHYREALRYYNPLLQVAGYNDVQIYLQMANCYRQVGLMDEAERCYKEAIAKDDRNRQARIQLAKMYERLGMPEKAFTYVNEVLELERQEAEEKRLARARTGLDSMDVSSGSFLPPPSQAPRENARRSQGNSVSVKERQERDEFQENAVRLQYIRLQALEERMQAGDEDATNEWMKAAAVMIDDFRSTKVFYPWDKYIRFLGYTRGSGWKSSKAKDDLVADMEAMEKRLRVSLGNERGPEETEEREIPTSFRGISFTEWLDVFLKFAMCLSKRSETRMAYDILVAAYDANVFFHSTDAGFLIHVCWAACALFANDDETICTVARWFMKEHQFTTDAYRFHAALNRFCKLPNTWYNSGPSQKFILRQIKAMDYSLVSEDVRVRHFGEKASYTARDRNGRLMLNEDMDVALLVLYGHMLYSGTNYAFALNYFFRAYALDPKNAMINLFVGLSYIHYSLKRQSANRQYLIMQGLSFLFRYYDIRQQSRDPVEVQEAEYNVARAFHTLGLSHLALPYYEKVLELSVSVRVHQNDSGQSCYQDFATDAAYNLQNIYSMTGNLELASQVTEKYLVI